MQITAVTNGVLSYQRLLAILPEIEDALKYIVIREKQVTKVEYLQLMENLIEKGVPKHKLIVHQHVDLAIKLEIPTLHLPEIGPSVKNIKFMYPHLKVGVSVHSLASAQEKEKEGADYLMYGHVFQTASKTNLAPKGLASLRQLTDSISVPVIAIGGITPSSLGQLGKAGAQGAAVMSGIFDHPDPRSSAEQYQREGELYGQSL
ncbi:thiamine phosphate synthase [Halobacillus salinarum]|uniref:Thiamine phosphate synthase n=1 Tax=Halobacillus salinarum TaxID=2932257 RepID=A0ABY4EEE3_9BACI|nr:thiamine phosphate synthase [Halobacillus salinarum]UOQ42832.1 thiamine phosphate synthase [Halobacillus salinarum]